MSFRVITFILIAAALAAQESRTSASRPEAAESRPGKAIFESGLKAAQAAAEEGKFQAGRELLDALLASHAQEDYVFARKTEIAELLSRDHSPRGSGPWCRRRPACRGLGSGFQFRPPRRSSPGRRR